MWEDEIKGAASDGRRGGGSRRWRVKKPWHVIFGERERGYLFEEGSEEKLSRLEQKTRDE